MSTPRPILISIDGGIGAGKSTILNKLRDANPDIHYIDEPVDTWTALKNEEGESLLEVFYKDKRRWSYTFQNCAILSRYRNTIRAIDEWRAECARNPEAARNNVFITERCLETDYNVFAQMLRDDGCIDGLEWDLYKQWYRQLIGTCTPLSGIIYVHAPPDVCNERIHKRAREGEEGIPVEYLTNLDKYHKRWIDHTTTPVLMYDNYNEDTKKRGRLSDISTFISRLQRGV